MLTHFGLRWLLFRLRYAVYLKSGISQRQTPMGSWDGYAPIAFLGDSRLADASAYFEYRENKAPEFFFSSASLHHSQKHFERFDLQSASLVDSADGLLNGTFRLFCKHTHFLGNPPDWHNNPFNGQRAPKDIHWSRLPDFGFGDIKSIWEASRFEFAYILVRAFYRTGNDQYPELFWQLFESWCQSNPPNHGVNWKCGQEVSLRLMAACFGLYGFWGHLATTPERVQLFLKFCQVSGVRIAANIDYAISQRNNHAISEAMGLWTIGTLFPELKRSKSWAEEGRNILEGLAKTLIYGDGSFVQHSVNYHRLMLHDYLYAVRLGDITEQPFSQALKNRLHAAGLFLYQLTNLKDGRVPNYGQNDGALILPLNNCDYRDYRPVVQAIYYLCTGRRCFASGPWDEDLLWLFGPNCLEGRITPSPQEDLSADQGGCYILRGRQSHVFLRCADYKHRPGQADQLHADLWWRGQNIAIDAGTFSYNAPAPWDNPLASTRYHNTVTVDDTDQMDRAGKFLWLPWAVGTVTQRGMLNGRFKYWEGTHNGYTRLKPAVTHRRGILNIDAESWLVIDRMESRRIHSYRLHWLLADFPFEWRPEIAKVILQTEHGSYNLQFGTFSDEPIFSAARADNGSPRGWHAPFYYHKEPAISIDMQVKGATVVMWSLFSSQLNDITVVGNLLNISTKDMTTGIEIGFSETESLIGQIQSSFLNGH